MMTALNIEDYTRGGMGGVLNLFKHNRLRVEHLYCDSAALKSICYEHYRGHVGWASVDRFVKAQRNRVLCPPSLDLPTESGYKRFVSYELSRRMCENAALYLLRSIDCPGLKVALVDDSGESVGLCAYLVDCADPIYIVTEATEIYLAQAERLLSEKGAALRVSKGSGCLRDADLIIAPGRIERDFDCSPAAMLLTGEQPAVPQNAPAVYEYTFTLPQKYLDIMPGYLEPMYFASALYTMAGAHELDAELFTRCGDGSVIHTRKSLLEQLKQNMNRKING